ncbi:hypothetical protein [Paractinoplanes maris]|uniref:hypothetical protein n=1 Tax=Paractinoplanes maris TaxID=1734446 RepID=UPI002021F4EB|nr:hypothetical protein [Actinoplanes maris]
MRRSAHRFAPLGPIVAAGALLSLLVPLATGHPALGRPLTWLSLHLLGWSTVAALLIGRRHHRADQIRLTQESEQLHRSIADCVTRFALDRAALGSAPVAMTTPGSVPEPHEEQISAIIDGIDDLLLALRADDISRLTDRSRPLGCSLPAAGLPFGSAPIPESPRRKEAPCPPLSLGARDG